MYIINTKNLKKNSIKSNKFCYCKVGRVLTKSGAKVKSPILLTKYLKNNDLILYLNILHFGCTNIIFTDFIHMGVLRGGDW